MASKPKRVIKNKTKKTDAPNGLWIAPRYSLKGPTGERAWETVLVEFRTVVDILNWQILLSA
jgi:hypothetical protein